MAAIWRRQLCKPVYEASGVGPEEIPIVELHDCFAHNEAISYEALGLCSTGEAKRFIADGDNTYGGRTVTNPSGGLFQKGHTLGATGLAQCYELSDQLRGSAGARQGEGARHALQHNLTERGVRSLGVAIMDPARQDRAGLAYREEQRLALSGQCGIMRPALLAGGDDPKSRAKPPSPFRCFNSSPEVIRLVVLMYVRFPLSLRNVEDLLFERGVDLCHETVRFWWNSFGPMFAGDIRRQRVIPMSINQNPCAHWRSPMDMMRQG